MKQIEAAHGTGGYTSQKLIQDVFRPKIGGKALSPNDAAFFLGKDKNYIITTDCHVVDPIIFPGGDIGKLAITGVINDLITQGGVPEFISLNFILEEGLSFSELTQILTSMSACLSQEGIDVLCADTKVIPSRSSTPGLFIGSTLIGEKIKSSLIFQGPQVHDRILCTGPIGSHGLAILQAREKLPFKTLIESDCVSLSGLLLPLLQEEPDIHYMRDPTRGGVASVLHELARQFQVSFKVEESQLPILPVVKTGLDILGLDPLEVANEGVMLLFVPENRAEKVLTYLRSLPLGRNAKIIGCVLAQSKVPLLLQTTLGGLRTVPWPEALNFPRIC